MLSYTGHPFVDVGIATIVAFAGKTRPEDVTPADLEQVAMYIEREYVRPPLRGHLTMAFTSNAWFIQDGFNPDRPELTPDQREARRQKRNDMHNRHALQWADAATPSDEETCVFTGSPAIAVKLSDKLPASRAGRAQIPLLQGDDAINFFAYGSSGLAISGTALLALQCFPLGCAKCGVGLLAVHSDNPRLTLEITREFWQQNIRAITQAQAAKEDKLPSAQRSLKTLLVETLLDAERKRSVAVQDEEPASLTAYNFNNGKSPALRIYQLPLEITTFLSRVTGPTYRDAWDKVVRRSWQITHPKMRKGVVVEEAPPSRINYLYEDLFNLPANAARFVRTYFLRIPRRTPFEDDPRRGYSVRSELDLAAWSLVELFLKEVLRMDQDRIARIAALGDGLAVYVRQQGGKNFFRSFFTEQKPSYFRTLLIKANMAHIRAGNPALFDMETYIDVFEEGDEVMRPDWWLARDLVLMRMIDQLKDWLARTPDALPADEIEADVVDATV